MFTLINSGGIWAVRGYIVSVEADVSNGLPGFSISGQLSSEIREAQDRVRTALKNSGYRLPPKKVTVSLSPAGIRKDGTAFDLPIAVAVLGAFGYLQTEGLKDSMIVGELGLDGRVKPVSGILVLAAAAREAGLKRLFLPAANAEEGRIIEGLEVIPVRALSHMASILNEPELPLSGTEPSKMSESPVSYGVDFSEINGQQVLKRAAEVAAAGMHGLLMNGSAGTGKTMIARRIPTILPSLTREENIEISKIYSICGQLPPGQALLSERPFRSPHHTISPHGLTGGGRPPRPGELSLASGGVLFLDELPLFGRQAIEVLRQPLEEKRIIVTRVTGNYEFPADFMLVAALNPCPCGYYPDRKRCSCSETQVRAYLNKISRPIMDRFDICAEAASLSFEELNQDARENESSAVIKARVEQAVKIQADRFKGTGIRFNSRMGAKEVRRFCVLGPKEEEFAGRVYQARNLSARGYHKVLKTARTIADLAGEEQIRTIHLAEAFGYRTLEERLWGGEG
ncbi:MAG: YifB family Mg chelatase-like AAA ATPase [Enterocloster sp.]